MKPTKQAYVIAGGSLGRYNWCNLLGIMQRKIQ